MRRRDMLIGAGGALALAGGAVAGWRSAVGSMGDLDSYMGGLRAPMPADPSMADIIRYATLAANGHNTQPWRFRVGESTIDILPDLSRATPVVDPDNHHLFVSLGCAAENLLIAGTATRRAGQLEVDARGESIRYPSPGLKFVHIRCLPRSPGGNPPEWNMMGARCLQRISSRFEGPPKRRAYVWSCLPTVRG